MRVHLTGGTGLLGSHAAERLRDAGHEVSALCRPGSETAHLRSLGCRIVEGDVREEHAMLARALGSADVVVHAAAQVYGSGPWPRIRAVNVEGTEHVVRAASAVGALHVVHVSSVAVYGGASGRVDEATPIDEPLPPSALYARSKREAEGVARATAAEHGLALTILRPCALYGERDRLMAPRLARVVAWPVIPVLGSGRTTLAVAYAGNVAEAIRLAVEQPPGAPGARVYDVAFDRPLTQVELLEGMAQALGRWRPRLMHLPEVLVRAGAKVGEALSLSIPGLGDLGLERVALLALQDNPYRSRRVREALGWMPPWSHEEGLRRTARWLQEAGLDGEPRREAS